MTRIALLLMFVLGLAVGRMFSTPTDERTVQTRAGPVVARVGTCKSGIAAGALKPNLPIQRNNVELKRENRRLSAELAATKEVLYQMENASDWSAKAASNYSEFDHEIVLSPDLVANLEEEEDWISQESQRQHEHYMDMLEQRFAGEILDSAWSAETAGAIRTAVESLYAEGALDFSFESLDCRTSMCRLEVGFNHRDEQHEFESRVLGAVGKLLPRFSARREREGDFVWAVYFFQSHEPDPV